MGSTGESVGLIWIMDGLRYGVWVELWRIVLMGFFYGFVGVYGLYLLMEGELSGMVDTAFYGFVLLLLSIAIVIGLFRINYDHS